MIASVFTDLIDGLIYRKRNTRNARPAFCRRYAARSSIGSTSRQTPGITSSSHPRAFAHWTGRPQGIVGGLGQHPSRFGPFGLASRTPMLTSGSAVIRSTPEKALPASACPADGLPTADGRAGTALTLR